MLRLEGVVIRNGDFTVSADFTVPTGSRVALIGPSGAGKTTLVEAIAGFRPALQGRILWDELDITDAMPGDRPVAMLFQDGNLFPHLTVERNVGLGISPNARVSGSDLARVHKALDRVGLNGLGGRKPAELSGGQQSRAALARILVQNRPLLLLDEPFAALGPALKTEMLDLVASLAEETGATVLMITHDPSDARRISDKVILVEAGQAHPPTATGPLLDNPPPTLRDYLG